MHRIQPPSTPGATPTGTSFFRHFVLRDRLYRGYLLAGGGIMLVAFVLFKILYPYPDFFSDSYYYIQTAANHWPVFVRPVGYAWFLSAVHSVAYPAFVLVALQYLLLLAGSAYLAFTVLYIFRPSRLAGGLLFLFVACNPVYLFLANLVSSDSLFTTLSLYWLALLLWIVYKPRPLHIIAQAFVLVAAFSVRYNALYYPLITLAALVYGRTTLPWKLTGFVLSSALVGGFMWYTVLGNQQVAGLPVFSGFSGWQSANNALYMYPHVRVDTNQWRYPASADIDRYVRHYFDTSHRQPTPFEGAVFLVNIYGPLKQYYFRQQAQHPGRPLLWSFDRAGEAFARYGQQLVAQHPVAFARYYLLPNTGAYFFPPLEQFSQYNEGWDNIAQPAADWFHFPDRQVQALSTHGQYYWLRWLPVLFGALNIALVAAGLRAWRSRVLQSLSPARRHCYRFLVLVLCCNAVFSIAASPIVFRYQVFSMTTGAALSVLQCSFLVRHKKRRQNQSGAFTA